MTERNLEVGPIVAASMIAIGMATVIWAVSTNPNRITSDKPKFEITTGTTAADPGDGVTDSEWEQTLIDVEKIKTDGLVIEVNASTQVATVDKEKWNALSDERRSEAGRHLAIYAGRIANTEEYKVKIVDQNGLELGSYERD